MGARAIWIVASTIAAIGGAMSAWAITPPEPGAVALPADFAISLPFPEGVPVRVSCGYGPGCSAYHVNTDTACCTNDFHALDLVRDQAGGGDGEPVTAIASGTVRYADWAGGGFASFGRYVVIEHDYAADGHSYWSIYAHLSAISVAVDEHVEAKQEIGLLGGSSNMLDDQFGAHVHVALYQDAAVGSGGAYGGRAVVPEPIDGYEDLDEGTVMVAGPGPMPPPAGTGSGGDDDGSSSDGGGTADPPPGADGSSGDPAGSDGDDEPGTTTAAATTNPSDDGDPPSSDTGAGALPPDSGRPGATGGCACSSGAPSFVSAWCLLLAFVRRRD